MTERESASLMSRTKRTTLVSVAILAAALWWMSNSIEMNPVAQVLTEPPWPHSASAEVALVGADPRLIGPVELGPEPATSRVLSLDKRSD